MSDQKNTILAIVLSALVLIVWQVFYGMPQMEKQKQIQQQQAQERSQQPPALPQQTPGTVPFGALPPSGGWGSGALGDISDDVGLGAAGGLATTTKSRSLSASRAAASGYLAAGRIPSWSPTAIAFAGFGSASATARMRSLFAW